MTAISLAICGPAIPGIVPAVLASPMSIPAYLGAISRWLMLNPAWLSALSPTPSVRKVTAVAVLVPKYPHSKRKVAANRNPVAHTHTHKEL